MHSEDKVRDQNKRLKQELKMLAQAADNAIVRELEVRNAKRNREGSQTETGLLLKSKRMDCLMS